MFVFSYLKLKKTLTTNYSCEISLLLLSNKGIANESNHF